MSEQTFQKDTSIHSKPTRDLEWQNHLFAEELGRGGKDSQRGKEEERKRERQERQGGRRRRFRKQVGGKRDRKGYEAGFT